MVEIQKIINYYHHFQIMNKINDLISALNSLSKKTLDSLKTIDNNIKEKIDILDKDTIIDLYKEINKNLDIQIKKLNKIK